MPLTKATYSMIENAPIMASDLGADPTGSNDSTAALKAMIDECIATGKSGYISPGTYLIQLGQLAFDNAHVNTPWPSIMTDGPMSVTLKAATNIDASFISITNGTASSATGQFWQGGLLGAVNFEPASGSVAGLTGMHGLVLRGIEDAEFGFMSATGIGGDTIHIERALFGGNNPDPYHVNRCRFEGISGVGNLGGTLYNDNYRGFAFNEIGSVFANGNSGGGVFGLGAGNNFASVGAAFCLGWAIGDQGDSTGGASNGNTIQAVEIDNCQNGVDTQNTSEGLTVQNLKIIHRYNTGPNATLMEGYWPRVSLRVGSTFRSVRDLYFNSVEDRVETGGALGDLGVLADFVNAGSNLSQVYISRNVSDNAGLGVTTANYYSNFNINSFNVYYRQRRTQVIDTTQSGVYLRARNSGAVAIPNSGFGGAGNWVAYDTVVGGNTANYNAGTYEYTAPTTATYRIRATLALVLPTATRVRMGIYINAALAHSAFDYAVTANAQTYTIEFTALVLQGQTIKINADQNSVGAVATGGTTGGVNDSYFSVEML